MKNRKFVVVAFLIVAVMLLGVGYAALTDTLTIIGNAHVDIDAANKTFDEKIYFSDAKVVSTTGTGTTEDTVGGVNTDDATYTVNSLATVGQVAVFQFTIKNDSNVDAVISIKDKKLSGDANPTNSNTDKFNVEYAFANNAETVTIAKQGGTAVVTVTVTLKEPVTNATSATFGIELTATSVDP